MGGGPRGSEIETGGFEGKICFESKKGEGLTSIEERCREEWEGERGELGWKGLNG